MSKVTITTAGMSLNLRENTLTLQMSAEDLATFLGGEFPIGGTLVTFEKAPEPTIEPGEQWQGPLKAKALHRGETVQNPSIGRRGKVDLPISDFPNSTDITGCWLICDDGYTRPCVSQDRAQWYRLIKAAGESPSC